MPPPALKFMPKYEAMKVMGAKSTVTRVMTIMKLLVSVR